MDRAYHGETCHGGCPGEGLWGLFTVSMFMWVLVGRQLISVACGLGRGLWLQACVYRQL